MSQTFQPVAPVAAAPPASPTEQNLLRVATTPRGETARWEGGIAWRDERCFQADRFNPCGNVGDFLTPDGTPPPGVTYAAPVVYRVQEVCPTTSGRDVNDIGQRALRQSRAAASYEIAAELQTGAASDLAPFIAPEGDQTVNVRLAGPDAQTIAGTWEPHAGLGALEAAARRSALGQDVLIHLPIELVPLLTNYLVSDGGLLKTPTGATIVADAGYSNLGPGGTPATGGIWAYATGPVVVRVHYPDSFYRPTSVLDNTFLVVADTLFVTQLSPCNIHALIIATPATT